MAKFRILRPAHKCQTPVEALQLTEDILRIESAANSLKGLDPGSIGVDREDGEKQLWTARELLRLWHRRAKERLRKEFLGVEK